MGHYSRAKCGIIHEPRVFVNIYSVTGQVYEPSIFQQVRILSIFIGANFWTPVFQFVLEIMCINIFGEILL